MMGIFDSKECLRKMKTLSDKIIYIKLNIYIRIYIFIYILIGEVCVL